MRTHLQVLSGALSMLLIVGCKVAPIQVIPQPREVAIAPAELPKVPPPDAVAAQVPAGYRVEVVLSGLTYPSSVEFDDAGNMYVAEAGYVYGDEARSAHQSVGRIGGRRAGSQRADQRPAVAPGQIVHFASRESF